MVRTKILTGDGGRPVRNGWLVLDVIGEESALTANLQSYNLEGSGRMFGVVKQKGKR